MFTGIVSDVGTVERLEDRGDLRARIRCKYPANGIALGASIACDGVCLTVVDQGADWFTADVMRQSLDMSTLGALTPGSPVNLERAVATHTRLGGHIVQGHVDGTGEVVARTPQPDWEVVRISLPSPLSRYVVEKGSITVDGISLTVSGLGPDWFEVSLIPTTLDLTTLGRAEIGAPVNLEVDVIAKYVERLLSQKDAPTSD